MATYAGWDTYGLRHQAKHLFAAELYAELYDLTLDREWLAVQRIFDPSRRNYAQSLDWAIQAAEIDKDGLPVLLVLTLLRATIASLAGQVTAAVLELMTRLGLGGQAEATIALQSDPLLKCEALCRLARMAQSKADGTRNYEILLEAETLTTNVTNPRTQTHMLALIATAAQEVEATDIFQRAIASIKEFYTNQGWTAAGIAREFDLLGHPDYLLALTTWDRGEEGQQQSDMTLSNRYAALSQLVPVAVAKRDQAVLKAIVDTANPLQETSRYLSAYEITGIVTALAAAGAADVAITLIAAWHEANQRHQMYNIQPLLEALARGAGLRGDVKTIEKAADLARTHLQEDTSSTPTLGKWLAHLREVGQQALGIGEMAQTEIQLAGIEGLTVNHPQRAQILWDQIRDEAGWLWRLFASKNQALIQAVMGVEISPSQTKSEETTSVAAPKLLAIGLALFRWQPDVDEKDSGLAECAKILTRLGDTNRAMSVVTEISNANIQSTTLAEVVRVSLARNEIEMALHAATKITRLDTRQWAINGIAEALVKMPREQAKGILQQLSGKIDVLAEDEALVQTALFPVLMSELARATSVSRVLSIVREAFGPTALLIILPALGEVIVIQKDAAAARELLAQIDVVGIKRTQREILAEKLPEPPGWTRDKERERMQQIKIIAALAEQWGTAGDEQDDPAMARQWAVSAAKAFDLVRQQIRQLLPLTARGRATAALARAARRLHDSKTLKEIHKQAAAIVGIHEVQRVRDEALVQVAVGLTETGNYLRREMLFQPPAVTDIRHKHYQAQALAEMSEVVRAAPSQKRLFRSGLSRDDLQYFADRLLDQARGALGLAKPRFSTKFTGFKLRPAFTTSGRKVETLATKAVQTPPFDDSQLSLVTYHSARPALEAIVGVFARAGRSDDVVQISEEAAAPGHKPAVVAAAVKALAQVGEVDKAQRLRQNLLSEPEQVLAAAALAAVLVGDDQMQAEELLRTEVLPRLWDRSYTEKALTFLGETAVHLPPLARLHLIHEVLHASRTRGRTDTLAAMAALVPAATTLMDGAQRRNIVEKIIETERWWRESAPPMLE